MHKSPVANQLKCIYRFRTKITVRNVQIDSFEVIGGRKGVLKTICFEDEWWIYVHERKDSWRGVCRIVNEKGSDK